MDVSRYLEVKPGPAAVFDTLATRADDVRYMQPSPAGWEPVTWADHARDIAGVAGWLAELGLAPEDRAAIFAPNSVAWMAAALGIQAAGGAMVPIYATNTAAQAGYVISHSDARVVFVDTQALLERVLAAPDALAAVERLVLIDPALDVAAAAERARACGAGAPSDAWLRERVTDWPAVLAAGATVSEAAVERRLAAVDVDQLGLMVYTSGTSGPPKGVPLTHRNVGVNARDWLTCLGSLLPDAGVDLLWLPMSHLFGLGEAGLGNTLGFTSYLCTPADVLELMPAVRPSVFMSVPAYWEKLATLAGGDRARLAELTGGRLRFCLSGGAGLKLEVKETFRAADMLIIEGYGLSETSPTLTMNRPEAYRFDTVGRPFPSVELRLAADGEIQARGENVFGGYHKDPEATRATFTDDGWIKTGDLGRFSDDGFLQIIGRKKEILVTAGGKNIPPANIELRFADDPLIGHLVVYGDGKKYLVAGVWLQPGVAATDDVSARVAARIDAVNAELPRYETIKRFVIMERPLTVEGGLLTPTLKLRRKHVEEAFRDAFEELYE